MPLHLLVSPLAKAAYYDAYLEVAAAELRACLRGFAPEPGREAELSVQQVGGLDFLILAGDEPWSPARLRALSRLSFVQGLFEQTPAGDLRALEHGPEFALPEALVFGVKYRGKTHELVTQLALNLALRACTSGREPLSLLDPVAGRGTTLLWSLRYGLHAVGIERDAKALDDLHRHVKKQTKLHRISHRHDSGRKSKGAGRFEQFELGERRLKLITGDSADAGELLKGQRFDLIVGDLPYGVQHGRGAGVLEALVRDCAPAWIERLRPGGAMVLIYNSYQPTRAQLEQAFAGLPCEVQAFTAAHRMSESIVRDLLLVTRPV